MGLGVGLGFMSRRVATTLAGPEGEAPAARTVDLKAIEAAIADKQATVTWVGHSTLLVTLDGMTFLTDPTWSHTASPLPVGPRRFVDPALDIDDLPPVDFVVVSHNHYDHLDLATLELLAARGTRIFMPLANAYLLEGRGLERITEMDWWDSVEVGNLRVHCVPARHWSRRGLMDRDRSLWSGWVIESNDRRFYFAGDTAEFSGFEEIRRRIGAPDLAAIPIGAYDPPEIMQPSHLNPEEAVAALEQLDANQSLAVHFGTFDLSDEPIDEPPRRFRAASDAAGRGEDRDWIFEVGETRAW
ncbi:MAG: N-acyl-phosphatidylethanolamine-hydrolyzing phospholipase D [Hyphomicrobiaceae bacterium]|jgi:N-acyl-phosphatidylethanolamine-hydrolysing phospholipase D